MARASMEGGNHNTYARKMSARYRTYLFALALTVAHELTHFFVAYLAQGRTTSDTYTPPTVSYLNYAAEVDGAGAPTVGESGRWLENVLFGGSIEFYRDVEDDDGQVRIPSFFLDMNLFNE